MSAADKEITYTAAEVAELIRPLSQSVEALQKENAELKRKLEHMRSVPLWWAERTGCSATVSRARNPVPLCTLWWKQPRPTVLSHTNI